MHTRSLRYRVFRYVFSVVLVWGSIVSTFIPLGTVVLRRLIHKVSLSFSRCSATSIGRLFGIVSVRVICMSYIVWCVFWKWACTCVGGVSGCMCSMNLRFF